MDVQPSDLIKYGNIVRWILNRTMIEMWGIDTDYVLGDYCG